MMMIGLMISNMVIEFGKILVFMFIKVSERKIEDMEKVHIIENLVKNMLMNRLMITNMIMEFKRINVGTLQR